MDGVKRGFIFSGMALLLAIPALIAAASLIKMMEKGDDINLLNVVSDKVFYAERDLDANIRRAICLYIGQSSDLINREQYIKNKLINEWIPYITNEYAKNMGVYINISNNIAVQAVNGTFKVSTSSGRGIPVEIRSPDGDVMKVISLGPYYMPDGCDKSGGLTTCVPESLVVYIDNPSSNTNYSGGCSSLGIKIKARVYDDCNVQKVGGDAAVVAEVYDSSDTLNTTVSLSDGDYDGVYEGTWNPTSSGIYKILVKATEATHGITGNSYVSNVGVNLSVSGNSNPPTISNVKPGNTTVCANVSTVTVTFNISDSDGNTVTWYLHAKNPIQVYSGTEPLSCSATTATVSQDINVLSPQTTYYINATDSLYTIKSPSTGYYVINVESDNSNYENLTTSLVGSSTLKVWLYYSGDCDGDSSATAKVVGTGYPSTPKNMSRYPGYYYTTFTGLSCGTTYTVSATLQDPDNTPTTNMSSTTVTTPACGGCTNYEPAKKPDKFKEKGGKNIGKNCGDGDTGTVKKGQDVEAKWNKDKIPDNICDATLWFRYRGKKGVPFKMKIEIDYNNTKKLIQKDIDVNTNSWNLYSIDLGGVDGTRDVKVTFKINKNNKEAEIDCTYLEYHYQ